MFAVGGWAPGAGVRAILWALIHDLDHALGSLLDVAHHKKACAGLHSFSKLRDQLRLEQTPLVVALLEPRVWHHHGDELDFSLPQDRAARGVSRSIWRHTTPCAGAKPGMPAGMTPGSRGAETRPTR